MVVCTQSWRNVRPVNGSWSTNDMQGNARRPAYTVMANCVGVVLPPLKLKGHVQ